MPIWVEKTVVLAIHDEQLSEHGGAVGIRDDNALESALARPQNIAAYWDKTFLGEPTEPTLMELAAAYAFGLARNHPFVDGNKRVSAVVTELFLELNGLRLIADDAEMVSTWLAIADGGMDEKEIATWIAAHTIV